MNILKTYKENLKNRLLSINVGFSKNISDTIIRLMSLFPAIVELNIEGINYSVWIYNRI